jgi:hypothetical protein
VRNKKFIHSRLKKASRNQKELSSFVEFFSIKCSDSIVIVLKYRLLQLLQFNSVAKKESLSD